MGSGRVVRSRKTVRQRGYTPPTGDPIYANDFDKEQATEGSSGWPFADQFEGWKNQTGTGADNVTYVANSISVRANSASNGNYSKYKDDASGVNNMLFRAGAEFEIHKIALDPAQKNLCLTFGSYKSLFGAEDNAFVTSEFHVYLSKDGENWAEIAYDRPVEADEHSNYGTWALATANFTLKEVPSELYIRFISDLSSAHRIDDVKLFEGIGGTEVDLGNVTPPTPGEAVVITIPEIIAKLTTSQVALDTNNDRYFEAVVVTDKEGGNFNGQNLQVMTPGATTAKNGITLYGSGKYTDPYDDGFTFVKGDKVKVTLKKGEARIVSYNGLYEVTGSKGADWVEIEKIGTETITPVVVDPAKLAEYQGMVVTVKGVTAPATAADWTTNEAFGKHTFTTSAGNMTVFVQKAMPGLVGTQFVAGSTGDITGYASVNSNAAQVCPQRPEDVAAFMGEPSTDPAITKLDPTSLSFAATDNAKTVTVTAANADGCTIEAATDKSEQFTTSVNGMVVTMTPKENTTEQAITATLTIKLMKDGAAVDTKTVAISQAGKSGSGGKTVTLSTEDIAAATGFGTQYGDLNITAADGSIWTGFVAGFGENYPFVQLGWNTNVSKTASKSYIKTAALSSNVKKITLVQNAKTIANRWMVALPADFEYTGQSADEVKALAYGVSNASTDKETAVFEIDLTGKNVSDFILRAVGGAVYLDSIVIELE